MVLLSASVISFAIVPVSFVASSFDVAVASDDNDEEERSPLYCFHIVRLLDCSRNSI
jgi:hypothetical protein